MSVAEAGATTIVITIGGITIPEDHQVSLTIDSDINQPDMAAITLYNQDHRYSSLQVADPVEITADGTSMYDGELVGLEPSYAAGEPATITIRAMDRFHRLLRIKKSVTFTNQTDQQILQQVVADAGLTLDWRHDTTITYKHVYQHNQTDMEFVRMRAARMGCHIWCVGTTLNIKQPDLSSFSGVNLTIDTATGPGDQLRAFRPKMSSAPIAASVQVKGWDPETKQLFVGTATAQASPLGAVNAATATGGLASTDSATVDQPIWSAEEANALAAAKLQDKALQFMTGEAEAIGDPKYVVATVISLTINTQNAGDVFNGKYYVMGVSHRYMASAKDMDGGFVTTFKLARDAECGQ